MKKKSPFSSVVFAGGGCRCLWQAGFMTEAAPALGIAPSEVAGASAGAAIACMYYAGRTGFAIEHFKKATSNNPRNFYFTHLFGHNPVFPHYSMYRDLMLSTMDPAAMKKLSSGPEIRILVSRPPAALGPRAATFIGLGAYLVDKHVYGSVHPKLPSAIGFRPEVSRAQDCSTPEELADLVLASSCTPPFTPIMRWNGGIALDGGLIDNVPLRALSGGKGNILILLTRRYKPEALPSVEGRLYVQPSRPSPIAKWDYTNPEGIQEVFDLGRKDGESFARTYRVE
ncbi:MAG: patatin-like phospholipase family protein [Spirochaetes bacterium]|jgi:predicted acylesterase/phospholipase RssA|nr:patatin-like phospholipase family protein [Spirochaetota bacterium]